MPDEPTLGEVIRTMQALNARLDRFSAPEVYAYQHEQVLAEIREIQAERAAEKRAAQEKERREEEARAAAEARRQQDRRLVFTALVAPVLLLFLQLYLTARGAGS
ncbi:hypothetical protein ACF06P_35305 [Streptomyces sp. NPDC015684]|uniref:hypothetical protein n=1 Tax=unclassified Streptomyces TaxID=2593676 RepID=UPI003702B101